MYFKGQPEGSAGKGTQLQAWWPKFKAQEHMGEGEAQLLHTMLWPPVCATAAHTCTHE